MPEGLEKDLPPQGMADLIAYLRAARPKVSGGSEPAVLRPGADGVLVMLASNCEIHGRTLVLDMQQAKLTNWNSEDDRAAWTVELPRPDKYNVWLEWSCAPDAAGNAFVLEAANERMTGKVAGTGGWKNYRRGRVGTIALPAGEQRLVFRADGKVRGALIDLKAVLLVPVTGK
jgi:hypothetical protein